MNRTVFKRTMLCSTIIGLVAHGYFITNFLYSHDSLQMLYISGAGDAFQIALGRPVNTLYNWLTSTIIAVPFLQGLSVILWLGLSAYVFNRIFNISDWIKIAVVAGVFETNLAVLSLLATYAPDAAPDCFGIFLATLSALFWNDNINNFRKRNLFISAFLLASSLAVYQCNGVLFTVIAVFVLIRNACGKGEAHTIRDGAYAFAVILISGILYFLIVKLFLYACSVNLIEDSYMSLSNAWTNDESIIDRIIAAYSQVKGVLWNNAVAVSYQWLIRLMNVVTIVVAILMALICLYRNNKLRGLCSVYVAVLFAAFPIAANYVRIFNKTTHSCHYFGIWMLYLLPVVLYDPEMFKGIADRAGKAIPLVIASLMILNNTQVSNVAYIKKQIDWNRVSSVMTDVLNRVGMIEGYREGVTKISFVGSPADALLPAYITTSLSSLEGMSVVVMQDIEHYRAYSEFILGRDKLLFVDESELNGNIMETVGEMEVYPSNGSVKQIDDTVIVRFK